MNTPPKKRFVMLALMGLGIMTLSADAAVIIRATETTLSAAPDPGSIVGDGANTTTTPTWRISGDIVQVADDSAVVDNPLFRARGIVQFGMPALSDGSYNLSMIVKTSNIRNSTNGGARDQSFAVRLLALGSAKLNGVVAGNSGWIIVKPLVADNTGGGNPVPWLNLSLAGGANTDFGISGAWDTSSLFSLEGADGINGSFRVEVLDGTGLNYGSINVDSFTFDAVPEPSTSIAALAVCALAAVSRYRNGRRKAA